MSDKKKLIDFCATVVQNLLKLRLDIDNGKYK